MTIFDERERAFENLFAHEERLRFLALSLRNQIFARWAAEQLSLRPSEYHSFVRSFAESAVRREPERALIERVRADFAAEGIDTDEERIHAAFAAAAAAAARQIRAEVHLPAT
jgi:hypothetical protein